MFASKAYQAVVRNNIGIAIKSLILVLLIYLPQTGDLYLHDRVMELFKSHFVF